MSIGIVTDSNSQFPVELAERFGVEIVPLTVTVDGTPYAEGVEITADQFFARFADGATPEVASAAPSPGAFVEAYQRLAGDGATEILSIHIGADVSGTLNAARLATGMVDVPVLLVDTGTASFGVACCVWEAALALQHGATVAEAAAVAETLAPSIGNVFVVGALDLAARGGRLRAGDEAATDDVPVLSLVDGQIQRVGAVDDLAGAADAMASYVTAHDADLRVAVGVADSAASDLWHELEDRLRDHPNVREMVRYRIGPSVAVHTGPGTAGAFFYRAR